MTCQVGPANADIAGLGIIISFAFQAGLSLFLSFYSFFLWRSAIISLGQLGHQVFGGGPDELAARTANQEEEILRTVFIEILDICRSILHLNRSSENVLTVLDQRQAGEDTTQVPTTSVGRLMWRGEEHVLLEKKCIDEILATIGDAQVINAMGLLIAALIQHETLSLYLLLLRACYVACHMLIQCDTWIPGPYGGQG